MVKIIVCACLLLATFLCTSGTVLNHKGDYRKPHEVDCFSYYQCNRQGICDVINCGRNEAFSAKLMRCVRSSGDCKRERVEPSFVNENCPAIDDPENPVHLPHEHDCNKFYACSNRKAVQRSCPDGLHWNIRANLCDYPLRSSCVLNCPAKNWTYLPHKSDCDKFYLCLANNPMLMNCPFGLFWNLEKNACDFKSRVVCVRK